MIQRYCCLSRYVGITAPRQTVQHLDAFFFFLRLFLSVNERHTRCGTIGPVPRVSCGRRACVLRVGRWAFIFPFVHVLLTTPKTQPIDKKEQRGRLICATFRCECQPEAHLLDHSPARYVFVSSCCCSFICALDNYSSNLWITSVSSQIPFVLHVIITTHLVISGTR